MTPYRPHPETSARVVDANYAPCHEMPANTACTMVSRGHAEIISDNPFTIRNFKVVTPSEVSSNASSN